MNSGSRPSEAEIAMQTGYRSRTCPSSLLGSMCLVLLASGCERLRVEATARHMRRERVFHEIHAGLQSFASEVEVTQMSTNAPFRSIRDIALYFDVPFFPDARVPFRESPLRLSSKGRYGRLKELPSGVAFGGAPMIWQLDVFPTGMPIDSHDDGGKITVVFWNGCTKLMLPSELEAHLVSTSQQHSDRPLSILDEWDADGRPLRRVLKAGHEIAVGE